MWVKSADLFVHSLLQQAPSPTLQDAGFIVFFFLLFSFFFFFFFFFAAYRIKSAFKPDALCIPVTVHSRSHYIESEINLAAI
jgi:hypothetical protein